MVNDGSPWSITGSEAPPWLKTGKEGSPLSINGVEEGQTSASKKHAFRKMYLAAVAALSFAIAMGMACGYTATATADMQRANSPVRPTNDEITWIGSLLALGALCGGVIAGYISNKFGRKGTLLLTTVPFVVGWLLIMYANGVVLIYLGRFITGACVGIVCVTTPAYLVEISTPDVRGLLGACFQLFIVIGVLFVNGCGSLLHWKWVTVASVIIIILALGIMCVVPESPRWLISKGNHQAAFASVKFLQGDFLDASAECVAIDEDLRLQPHGSISFKELLRPGSYIPAILSVALVFFQQACGSNAVLFYTVEIFQNAGSSLDPNVATIIIDVVLVLSTAVSSGLMDKVGRKILLIVSGIGMCISLSVLGAYDYVSTTNLVFKEQYSWIPLVSLIIYITAFSLGFGPIPWLMMAEMTSVRIRSLISGGATAFCWLFVFIVTKTFQSLEVSIHDYGAYWLYAAFSLLGSIFAYLCLPETRGKTFDEIQEFFKNYRLRKKQGSYDDMFAG